MEKRTSASIAGLPPGVRFNPTDQELITNYLLNKVQGKPIPSSTAVIDCDVYGEGHVWRRLFEETIENSLYFFTRLKKKTEKGKRVDRVTDFGTWKGQQRDKQIFVSSGGRKFLIGSKRSFSFIPKNGIQETPGRWVMHEYRLEGCLLDHQNNNFYVICRIINKKSKLRTATYDDDDLGVNGAIICAPTDVEGHHFNHVNHVSHYIEDDGLNVSYNTGGEPLNAVHGDGTKECLNGSDYATGHGLNVYDCMAGDGLNVSDYMGGDDLNMFDYMGGDDIGECFNVSGHYSIGDDDIGECLNVSKHMVWNGLWQQQSSSGSSDLANHLINRNDTGECLNVSKHRGRNGLQQQQSSSASSDLASHDVIGR